MSTTPLRTPAIRRTLRELFGPRRPPQSVRPGTPTPSDTPARRVPAPRYEALAIGLGCDHLGRDTTRLHR
ncbi:MAG TPA: hypothetical protein VK923_03780 [Euzebyales bacterium]|nr:hypothetical protein [Euzebyales bacterium]